MQEFFYKSNILKENYQKAFKKMTIFLSNRMSSVMSLECHSHVISFVCQSYVLVCHLHVTRMYSYVNRISLICTRMSSVCHSHRLVCHPYVTRMYSYVIRMSLICGFTMNPTLRSVVIH